MDVEVVIAAGARVAEGPVWDPSSATLLWVDVAQSLVHRSHPGTGTDEVMAVEAQVGAVGIRAQGGLVLATREGFAALDDQSGHLRLLARIAASHPGSRMNDGKVDAAGRFWAGTAGRPDAGRLYRLDPDHRVHVMLEGVTTSNGLDWSPDGRTLYYVDTATLGVDAFDFDLDTGAVRDRRRVVDVAPPGRPDGLCVDREGTIWVALWGGHAVHRYDPHGRLLAQVKVPVARVTSCAFGGRDLDVLYITTAMDPQAATADPDEPLAGSLFACRPGTTGQPVRRFAG